MFLYHLPWNSAFVPSFQYEWQVPIFEKLCRGLVTLSLEVYIQLLQNYNFMYLFIRSNENTIQADDALKSIGKKPIRAVEALNQFSRYSSLATSAKY
jgi:hypothetical protein